MNSKRILIYQMKTNQNRSGEFFRMKRDKFYGFWLCKKLLHSTLFMLQNL